MSGPGGEPEQCDEGNANDESSACLPDCAAAVCGDGYVQFGVEECDDFSTTVSCTTLGWDSGTADCYTPGDPNECHYYGNCCNFPNSGCAEDIDCCGGPDYGCNMLGICSYGGV